MKKLAILLVIVLAVLFGVIYLAGRFVPAPGDRGGDGPAPKPTAPSWTACTEDAKVCPDGTSVGRDPLNRCEFYPCPEEPADDDETLVCTMEARVCPDGSGVGRDGARGCAFAPCPGEGTVTGTLTLAPQCPYETVFDKPCPTSPYEGEIYLEPKAGGAVVSAAVSGGKFYATLPAGGYTISSGRVLPRCEASFTVREGEETTFAASCDSGIR
jgi:hypothetical protein